MWMSIRLYKMYRRSGGVIVISEAYDLACRTLQNVGQLEVDREIVARRICKP